MQWFSSSVSRYDVVYLVYEFYNEHVLLHNLVVVGIHVSRVLVGRVHQLCFVFVAVRTRAEYHRLELNHRRLVQVSATNTGNFHMHHLQSTTITPAGAQSAVERICET